MQTKFLVLAIFFFSYTANAFAQAGSYTDPVQAYNRLVIEKNSNSNKYYQVGNFKVVGTPYLFGEDQAGDVFSSTGSIPRVNVRYNIFTQEVETSAKYGGSANTVSIDIANVDSFILIANENHVADLKFVNRKLFNSKPRGFLQEVYKGKEYSLYKSYNSVLEIVTNNYIQSELRQFAVNYSFYYNKKGSSDIILLKNNDSFLKKEFAFKTDISSFLSENRNLPQEKKLTLLFQSINK
jgi:hypothetical protein